MFTSISSPTHVSHVSTSCDRKKLKQLRSRRVDRSHVLFDAARWRARPTPKNVSSSLEWGFALFLETTILRFTISFWKELLVLLQLTGLTLPIFQPSLQLNRNFDNEGYIDKKNDRRLDDCLRYALVSGNKALEDAGLAGEALAKVDKQRVGVLCAQVWWAHSFSRRR